MSKYPCPACVGTMPPGTPYMSLAKMLEKGSGQVYHAYSGAVGYNNVPPPGNWYPCHRCDGTGLVDDRRRNRPGDRRR